MPCGRLFMHPSHAQQFFLRESRGQDLQADGQVALCETAGNADAGYARQVATDRVDIGQVHGERVVHFFADLEGGGG